MDTTDPDIIFDSQGVSNHYYDYIDNINNRLGNKDDLDKIIKKINRNNNKYNCLIGISGGVDSSYVAYVCKNYNLRPLAVHFDNGWNSELSVRNIELVLKKLDIDLYTYVVDWEEFRDIQLSFLKASVPDLEIPSDHAINATLFKIASKFNIKYIISGMNFKSESIMPKKWAYGHSDWKYIKSIHKIFGKYKIDTYPHYSFFTLFKYLFIKKIKVVSILNFIDYDKEKAMSLLKDKFNWKYYGGKHYESYYTRIVQSFILPYKFNIDKRKAHLSNMILVNQITRRESLNILKKPPSNNKTIKNYKKFLISKFNITNEDLNIILSNPPKIFNDYSNNFRIFSFLKKIQLLLRKHNYISK